MSLEDKKDQRCDTCEFKFNCIVYASKIDATHVLDDEVAKRITCRYRRVKERPNEHENALPSQR